MRYGVLYVLGAAVLAAVVAIGWWSLQVGQQASGTYTVIPGDTVTSVAAQLGIPAPDLAKANGTSVGTWELVPGATIIVPPKERTTTDTIVLDLAGLVCELAGLLVGFWLAVVARILPGRARRPVLGIAFLLAVASYGFSQLPAAGTARLTPQLAFDAAKDGFAWAAFVALLARAIGIREAPPVEPAQVEHADPDTNVAQ